MEVNEIKANIIVIFPEREAYYVQKIERDLFDGFIESIKHEFGEKI